MVSCTHLDRNREAAPRSDVCDQCLRAGTRWVALRKCLTCGQVGCCDSSRGQHARAHFHATQHPLIEPLHGEKWTWCYLDNAYVDRTEGSQPHA